MGSDHELITCCNAAPAQGLATSPNNTESYSPSCIHHTLHAPRSFEAWHSNLNTLIRCIIFKLDSTDAQRYDIAPQVCGRAACVTACYKLVTKLPARSRSVSM